MLLTSPSKASDLQRLIFFEIRSGLHGKQANAGIKTSLRQAS